MSVLHSSIIPKRIQGQLKKNTTKRQSMPYQQVKRVGIMFTMTRLDDFEAIRKFEQKLKKENKEVEVISFLPKSVENFHFHYDIFQQKDFGATGKPKAENINTFINQSYDYLICLDSEPNQYLQYILAASKAKLRLGFASEEWNPVFDLAIKLPGNQQSVAQLIDQIVHYTSEFNGN